MGQDKALLPWEGTTFVGRLTSLLFSYCREIALVGRDQRQLDQLRGALEDRAGSLCLVADQEPGGGPLMGIYSGLRALESSRALVCAVDMPFVQPALVAFLLTQADDESLLVPLVAGVPQVLLAVYPRSLVDAIEGRLRVGRRDPRSLLEVVTVRYIEEEQLRLVDPSLRSFVNINTPQELARSLPPV